MPWRKRCRWVSETSKAAGILHADVVLGSCGCPGGPGEMDLSHFLPASLGAPSQMAELVPIAGTANGESHLQPLTSSGSSVGPLTPWKAAAPPRPRSPGAT